MTVRNLCPVLLLAGAVTFAGCGGSSSSNAANGPTAPTPLPATCANLAGTWHAGWIMDCGPDAKGASEVFVGQTGCMVVFGISGLGGFSGTIEGNQSKTNLVLQFDRNAPGAGPACKEVSEGSLRVQADGSVEIPFGTDPAPCCRHGNITLRR